MSFVNQSQRAVVAFLLSLSFAIAASAVWVAFGEVPAHPGVIESASLEASHEATAAPAKEGTGS